MWFLHANRLTECGRVGKNVTRRVHCADLRGHCPCGSILDVHITNKKCSVGIRNLCKYQAISGMVVGSGRFTGATQEEEFWRCGPGAEPLFCRYIGRWARCCRSDGRHCSLYPSTTASQHFCPQRCWECRLSKPAGWQWWFTSGCHLVSDLTAYVVHTPILSTVLPC